MATTTGFEAHRTGFRKHHRSTLNVVLHLGLTPTGLLGALGVLARAASPEVATAAAAAYAASLALAVPFPLFVASALVTAGLAHACAHLALGYAACAALLGASYFGQDVAHWLTGESTYQSSYAAAVGFWGLLAQHTYYLLPLALDSAHAVGLASGLLLWLTPRNDVLFTKLVGAEASRAITALREWVVSQKPSETCTTHWWALELPPAQKAAFETIAEGEEMKRMFHGRFSASQYAVESLPGMNEVYVASTVHSSNSDTVFFMDHVDGPYMLYPFCYVYRTLVAITTNTQISTVFPMQPFRVAISDGEVIGLDFHREVHRIENDPTRPNKDRRITCKMHYVVYPKCLGPVGRYLGVLTVKYNERFRYLFVNTISAQTAFWKFMTKMVLVGTEATFRMEQLLGLNNVAALGALAAVQALVGGHFFLAATSFAHHLKAIATFYHRQSASTGKLQRDSIVAKAISFAQMGLLYARHVTPADSASITLVACGLALSTAAFARLGLARTYFGSEMGVCEPKRIRAFPYGAVPHPMALGSLIALGGAYLLPGLRADVPWLVPTHAALTGLHLAQEILDIHA
ncbi:hypothetical protein KFE25_004309 [Diacronema lutheri]|uniref:phosphatidyl-N-methylethanolamine N-methyltransferase n=1 Tax=Diacronema lutheri TaxID=2081491 RepID=A0A8J5X4X0_DIALT|nr:hypothetical protein KFE25_004309 [Diacronema lutheri]